MDSLLQESANPKIIARLVALQSGQPVLGVLNLGQARIGVLPEVEEALEILSGSDLYALSLIELRQSVVIFRVNQKWCSAFWIKGGQSFIFGDGLINIPAL